MKAWFSKNKKFLFRLTGSLLAVGGLILLMKQQGWDEIAGAFRQVPVSTFLAATALMLLSRLLISTRWYVLLRAAGINISWRRAVSLTFTGLFSANFLPTTIGGDVVRLAAIMGMGHDRARCLASLAADRLVGMAGMTLTVPLGLVPIFSLDPSGVQQSFSLLALWKRGWDFIRRTFEALKIYLKKPLSLLLALAITLVHGLCIFLVLYLFIEGLGEGMPFWVVIGLYSVTYFVTLIPVSINGLGLQELSISYLFSAVGGISMPASLSLAVLLRVIFLLVSLPGAALLPSVLGQLNGLESKDELG